VDAGDDRLLHVEEAVDEAAREVELLPDHRAVPEQPQVVLQVAASAEGASRAREHHHGGRAVAMQVLEQAQQLGLHREVDRVEPLRRVQGDAQHGALALDEQAFVSGVVHQAARVPAWPAISARRGAGAHSAPWLACSWRTVAWISPQPRRAAQYIGPPWWRGKP
jgi:hypothetical protein